MEISPQQRSDIGYGILMALVANVDQSIGYDDNIHNLRQDECNLIDRTELAEDISPNNVALIADEILGNVITELESDIYAPFNIIVTQLQILHDQLVSTGNSNPHLTMASELLVEYKADVIRENLPQ